MGEGDHRSTTLGIASYCRGSLKRSSFVAVAKGCKRRRRLSRGPRVFDEAVRGSALLCLSTSKPSWQWEDSRFVLAGPCCPTVHESQSSFSSLFSSSHLTTASDTSKISQPKHSVIRCHRHEHATCPSHRAAFFPSSDMITRQTPARKRKPSACSVHRRASFARPEAWTHCPGTCILLVHDTTYNIQQHPPLPYEQAPRTDVQLQARCHMAPA